jgi:dsDNA-binding SOS-regulon protein/uncharacterized protein (UPF0335 family)
MQFKKSELKNLIKEEVQRKKQIEDLQAKKAKLNEELSDIMKEGVGHLELKKLSRELYSVIKKQIPDILINIDGNSDKPVIVGVHTQKTQNHIDPNNVVVIKTNEKDGFINVHLGNNQLFTSVNTAIANYVKTSYPNIEFGYNGKNDINLRLKQTAKGTPVNQKQRQNAPRPAQQAVQPQAQQQLQAVAESIKNLKAKRAKLLKELQCAMDECGMGMEEGNYDNEKEGSSYKTALNDIKNTADSVEKMIDADDNLPSWVQDKITLAKHNIEAISSFLKNQKLEKDLSEHGDGIGLGIKHLASEEERLA